MISLSLLKNRESMKPEVKYRLIEKLVHTKDEAILGQIEEILEGSSLISDEMKEDLTDEWKSIKKERVSYTWEEVKAYIKAQRNNPALS